MSTKKHGFRIWGDVYPIYNVIASVFGQICVVPLNRGKQRSLARERALVCGFAYIDRASLEGRAYRHGISVVEILHSASGRGELAEMKMQ